MFYPYAIKNASRRTVGPQYSLLFALHELGRHAQLGVDTHLSMRVPQKILKKSISLYYIDANKGAQDNVFWLWRRAAWYLDFIQHIVDNNIIIDITEQNQLVGWLMLLLWMLVEKL